MKKESRNIYDQYITRENLYRMWRVIKSTCKNKKKVFYFSLNLNTNIDYIYYSLKNKTYRPLKYITFLIFEPKPRLVMSQEISDKIVNHFITNYYLIPYLEKCLINENVATRRGKGSKYAMELIKKYFNKLLINYPDQEVYCLKIDVRKYFYSIDHGILLEKLQRKIMDPNVINIIRTIISETNSNYINNNIKYYNEIYNTDIPFYIENKGLSIGAMTSQFLAIFYLNDLDHYIKEVLKCKYYIRYMDDFLILDTDKDKLKKYYSIISDKLNEIKLSVNKKSNLYKSSNGFSFLGYKYRIINNKLLISFNNKTYKRIKKKLKHLSSIDGIKYNRSLASYYGYFKSIYKLEKGNFKMKSMDKYYAYKKKYKDSIIIIKEGIFYKTYLDDAKIMWYLFDYKYVKDSVSFGNKPYDKVIDKLRKLDISFLVVDGDKESLKFIREQDIYQSYLMLANKSFEKMMIKEQLVSKLQKILNCIVECYEEVSLFLDKFMSVSG